MWGKRIYLKSRKRKPIFLGVYPPKTDTQGAIPRGWCLSCGAEVYSEEEDYCIRCKKN